LGTQLTFAIGVAAILWLFYIAIEPFVRRQMPHILISWSRLVGGDWRDPLTARDVLGGCAAGLLVATIQAAATLTTIQAVPTWRFTPPLEVLAGGSAASGRAIAAAVVMGISVVVALLLLFIALRMVARTTPRAAFLFLVLRMLPGIGAAWTTGSAIFTIGLGLAGAVQLASLLRFGLLGGLTAGIVAMLFQNPITTDWQAWYAGPTIVAVAAVVVTTIVSARIALGNRRSANVRDEWIE